MTKDELIERLIAEASELVQEELASRMQADDNHAKSHADADDSDDAPSDDERADLDKAEQKFGIQEALLEFVEQEDGVMVLRDTKSQDDPLVTISFSPKVKEMVGGDVAFIGQQMIHAAVASVMQRQMNFWHAHIYDEEPEHYS